MNKFRKPHGNGGHGGSRFGGGRPSRPGFDRPRPQFGGGHKEGIELFDAICSKCGNACQVPFRPNGQKPVYCRACFGSPAQAPAGRENFIRRDVPMAPMAPIAPRIEDRSIADLKQQMSAMNAKMDNILRIVETLSKQKPVVPVAPAVTVSAPVSTPISTKIAAKKIVKKDLSKKKIAAKKKK
jgi:CxxC-x17-CxxC domain-containing protein